VHEEAVQPRPEPTAAGGYSFRGVLSILLGVVVLQTAMPRWSFWPVHYLVTFFHESGQFAGNFMNIIFDSFGILEDVFFAIFLDDDLQAFIANLSKITVPAL